MHPALGYLIHSRPYGQRLPVANVVPLPFTQEVKVLHGQIASLELRLLSSGRAAKETADGLRAELQAARAAVVATEAKVRALTKAASRTAATANHVALQSEVEKLRKENKSLREAAQDWGFKEKRLDLDKEQAELRISRLEEKVRTLEDGIQD